MTVKHNFDPHLHLPQFQILTPLENSERNWMEDINLAIQDLAAKWPWTRNWYAGPDPFGQIGTAYEFLKGCDRRKTIDRTRTSCGFKHDVERAMGGYIAEGYFTVAAKVHDFMLQARGSESFSFNILSDRRFYERLKSMYANRTSRNGAASINLQVAT